MLSLTNRISSKLVTHYLVKEIEAKHLRTTSDWVIARSPEEARQRIADLFRLDLSDLPCELEQGNF